MDFVELYYKNVHGYYPFETDENKIKSQKIIDYLSDAGISGGDIFTFIYNAPPSDFLSYEMLPESLWENSLLMKGSFYFHSELHILSKPPTWDPISKKEKMDPFYREMKIKYTFNDAVNYFYSQMKIDKLYMDEKRDLAAAKHLFDKFWKFNSKQIDVLLYCIDYAANQECKVKTLIEIGQYEIEVFEALERNMAEAKLHNLNKIIWR